MIIKKTSIGWDLSHAAVEDAIRSMRTHPNIAGGLRLQVHPDSIICALKVVADYPERIDVEITPVGKRDAWALWLYEDCVWSEGA